MKKIGKRINHVFQTAAILPTAMLGIGLVAPAHLALAAADDPTEIIVTARREKEELQKVPISMTVFDQETLSDRNVTNGADLVAYTPSLNVNQRFGSDQASFAIRGFSQDLRTTASVGVYFADVVAPRSSGSITAGDGAGPGSFFDLQNVQVLKGPQGTLFGRNTTGGAIQLVPQQPTDKLEGYLELSGGNYDMRRTQGVFNLPLTDIARARFGVDSMDREGYIKNKSGVGPERLSDVHYIAGRASLMLDLSDSVRNYFITQYTRSENKGSIQRIIACNGLDAHSQPIGFSPLCKEALEKQGDDFYTALSADHPDPKASLKQWQFVNTTTWDVNDNFEVTNILGYADLLQNMRGSVFGSQYFMSGIDTPSGGPAQLVTFPAGQAPGIPSNSQTTFSEELRFFTKLFNEKLHLQAGLYYEESRPDGWSGSQSAGMLICDKSSSYEDADPANFLCYDRVGYSSRNPLTGKTDFQGSIERGIGKMFYKNQAIYTQGTYELTEKLKTTLGIRYTVDDTEGESKRITYQFPQDITPVFSAPTVVKCSVASASFDTGCLYRVKDRSEAPTWTLSFEYSPIDEVMAYSKYTRGYRQGSIVLPAPGGFDKYDPEEVDAYELGTKTKFQGLVSGTFNISLFYNKLKNQQLQLGLTPDAGGSATTTIQNANKSTIQGVEAETTLLLSDGLTYTLSYTYLETHLDSMDPPLAIDLWTEVPSAIEGQHLTFSPRHAVTTGLNYRLPLPLEVGDVTVGLNYTFISSQNSTNTARKKFNAEDDYQDPNGLIGVDFIDPNRDTIEVKGSPYGRLPARQLLNFNLGWKAIFGSPFDASFFVTNALKEEYNAYVSGLYNSSGAEYGVAGEPRMYGAKIKYNFGL